MFNLVDMLLWNLMWPTFQSLDFSLIFHATAILSLADWLASVMI